jgi:hypothetical protein
MNNSPPDRRSPLGLFPGPPVWRSSDRAVEVLRTRHWRFLVLPTKRGFMQVSLNLSQTLGDSPDRRGGKSC